MFKTFRTFVAAAALLLLAVPATVVPVFAQAPSPLPQPTVQFYGLDALTLFKMYSRDDYRAKFGKGAPACDPTRAFKSWFDSTVDLSEPDALVLYKQGGKAADGSPALRQYAIPALEASTVNLPGVETYPAYTPASTNATSGGSPINPIYLSLQADAQALMNTLGGTNLQQQPGVTYPSDESRRVWSFSIGPQAGFNVGELISLRNVDGVGAPGNWSQPGTIPVNWTPTPPPDCSGVLSVRLSPVRDLLPNEKWNISGLGAVGLERTDLETIANQTADYFTTDDRTTLQQILKLLQSLTPVQTLAH